MSQYPLEPCRERILEMGAQALELAASYLEGLDSMPAHGLAGAAELAQEWDEPEPPEEGQPLENLLETFRQGVEHSINTAGAGYLAYIPGGGIFEAALADFLAATTNRYVGLWGPAPPLVQLEWNVVRWFANFLGFPDTSAGVLTTGGSLANLGAITCARTCRLPENFLSGTLYVTDQAHQSVERAARLAGFPASSIRPVATDAALRMSLDGLGRQVRHDREQGLSPFMVVASGGTTNTGAIDPLEDLASFCRDEALWLHVDAAYGGFFMLTQRGRRVLSGLNRADSVTLDPHKGLFLPYGTGALLVRRPEDLKRTYGHQAEYLQDLCGAGVNFSELSPEQSRGFRGLRVWLPLKLHGFRAFRQLLDEKLDLARLAWRFLKDEPGFECLAPPELSLVAFRYQPEKGDADAFNQELLRRVLSERRVFLSSTQIHGRFTLRLCILCFRTHRPQVETALESLARHARSMNSDSFEPDSLD